MCADAVFTNKTHILYATQEHICSELELKKKKETHVYVYEYCNVYTPLYKVI